MISNASGSVLVDGIQLGKVGYKGSDSKIHESAFYVVGEDGNVHAAMPIYMYDTLAMYNIARVEVASSFHYTLTGTCAPVHSEVYVTPEPDVLSSKTLVEEAIACVPSDDEGLFTVPDITGIDGTLLVWIKVSPEYAEMASVTCDVTITDSSETGVLLSESFQARNDFITCPDCGGTGKVETQTCTRCSGAGSYKYAAPRVRVQGTCPADVQTVYISPKPSDDEPDVNAAIINNAYDSFPSPNGEYTLEYNCIENGEYVVWGITYAGGVLTIDSVSVVSSHSSSCLSGDTLITMADGTLRRMDELYLGDLVMSEDGSPTAICKIGRGHFNHYHILYTFDDGTVIDETHEHRFFNVEQGFWQRLCNWKIGEHAKNQNGNEPALISILRVNESAEMFGIWTEEGTYYANGLLSGAATCNKSLLATATAEQAVDMFMSADEHHLLEVFNFGGVLP